MHIHNFLFYFFIFFYNFFFEGPHFEENFIWKTSISKTRTIHKFDHDSWNSISYQGRSAWGKCRPCTRGWWHSRGCKAIRELGLAGQWPKNPKEIRSPIKPSKETGRWVQQTLNGWQREADVRCMDGKP